MIRMQNIKQIDPHKFTNRQKQKINLLDTVVKDTTLMTEVKLKHYRVTKRHTHTWQQRREGLRKPTLQYTSTRYTINILLHNII